MNPSSQPPLDYLNQIAPSAPKKAPFQFNLRTAIIGGVLLIGLFVAINAISSFISSSQKDPWMQLSARLSATEEIVATAGPLIKNSQLKSANSDLSLYLANTIRDIDTPLKSLGIDNAKISKDILAKESNEAMAKRLEDARLNAKYDSTYSREMAYQLATVLSLIKQLYETSSKAETKSTLSTAYDSLVPIQKTFADFSASNE